MLFWLAQAAKSARKTAGRRQIHVAASGVGKDQSTVNRFEKAGAWPRNPDQMVQQYADDLDIDPLDIWAEALRLWRAHRDDEGGGARETLTRLSGGPGGQNTARPARQQ